MVTKTGIKVSKSGRSVNSTDENDFYVDSDTPLLKIQTIKRGTFSFHYLTDSGQFLSLYYHELGYVPAFLLFVEYKSGSARILSTSYSGSIPLAAGGYDTGGMAALSLADENEIYIIPIGEVDQEVGYTLIVFYDETFTKQGIV